MTLTLPLPAALELKMQPHNARLHFAVGAFAAEEVTLGQAAAMADVSQADFMRELSRRRIPLHYDREEFAEDLRTVAMLNEHMDHARHQ